MIGPANFAAWIERNKSFSHLAMVGPARLSLLLGGQPEEVAGVSALSEVFPALGVNPALGRGHNASEDLQGNDLVIVLSHDLWQRGSVDAAMSSAPISTNGRQRTVVGVMPEGFTVAGQKTDFLIPYGWTMERLRAAGGRGNSSAVARLRDGVTVEQASDDMKTIAARRAAEAPQLNTGWKRAEKAVSIAKSSASSAISRCVRPKERFVLPCIRHTRS